jgi:hypothetical protein
MGQKYYKTTVIRGAHYVRCVIWDGVHDYESRPPVEALCITENLDGPDLLIMQIRHGHGVAKVVATLLGTTTGIILWARNHKAYRTAVDEMERQPGRVWRQ